MIDTLSWLLEGDPAIRWLAHRDLHGWPSDVVEGERARIATDEGWGHRLLELQGPDGRWAASQGPASYRGLYIPKWTSTTYTLLLLARLGLPSGNEQALAGCRELAEGGRWLSSGGLSLWSVAGDDICVDAMVLLIFDSFDYPNEERREGLGARLLASQLPDGAWNCREGATHSSSSTTLAVLEALLPRSSQPGVSEALAAGREFLLRHHLFRSHHTGNVVSSAFTGLRIPVGWQYDVLRALDHFVAAGTFLDARLDDALALIRRRRRSDGRWLGTRTQAGALHFELEAPGEPSRWVTLRCLRALRAFPGTNDNPAIPGELS